MSGKNKKKPSLPKVRRRWTINPKSRVKLSDKAYHRPSEKKKVKNWQDEIRWFGE